MGRKGRAYALIGHRESRIDSCPLELTLAREKIAYKGIAFDYARMHPINAERVATKVFNQLPEARNIIGNLHGARPVHSTGIYFRKIA